MSKQLVIDGDSLIYKTCHPTIYHFVDGVGYRSKEMAMKCAFERDATVIDAKVLPTVDESILMLRIKIKSIFNAVKQFIPNVEDNYIIYLSPTGVDYVANYRLGINSVAPYKGNRLLAPKPPNFTALFSHLLQKYRTDVAEGCEADDLCGIAASEGHLVAAIDKDVLYSCPGHKFNYDTQEFHIQSEEDAWRYFFTQTLTGDTADNIPGLYRVGEAAAGKILNNVESSPRALYDAVLATYKEYLKGMNPKKVEMDILHNVCRLLWIQRKKNDCYRDYLEGGVND